MKNFNLNNLVRANIKNLKPYSSARDEFKDATSAEMVFLDANENPYENGVNRYPDPQQRNLKELVGEIKGIPTQNILLGNGSDEVLDLIFRAFCEPKINNIITLPPTYGMYAVLANINDIENREVLLTVDFQPNMDEIFKNIDENTNLLFICSPNNPTGNSIEISKIEYILSNFNGLVVIDEAYIDFSENESFSKRLDEFPNLIVIQTLSKAYGLAGIRLGICFASAQIINILNKIKPPYNVNELSQQKAIERISKSVEIRKEVFEILKGKNLLIKALGNISFVKKIYPTDANFVLVKVDDATFRYNQLIKKGLVVRNRTTQPLCENCLRFTVGTSEENKKLVTALQQLAVSI